MFPLAIVPLIPLLLNPDLHLVQNVISPKPKFVHNDEGFTFFKWAESSGIVHFPYMSPDRQVVLIGDFELVKTILRHPDRLAKAASQSQKNIYTTSYSNLVDSKTLIALAIAGKLPKMYPSYTAPHTNVWCFPTGLCRVVFGGEIGGHAALEASQDFLEKHRIEIVETRHRSGRSIEYITAPGNSKFKDAWELAEFLYAHPFVSKSYPIFIFKTKWDVK